MATASSLLLDSPLRASARKRRYSALELLTISPPKPEDAKRPRILVVDDDTPTCVSDTSLGSEPAEDSAASESDASSSESSSTSSAALPSAAAQVVPHACPDEVADPDEVAIEDADEDYTSSSGDSDSGESTSSSSASSSSGSDSRAEPTGLAGVALPSSSVLAARLRAFLPAMSVANAQLEAERAAGELAGRTMEVAEGDSAEGEDDDEEGGAPLIEMDLGLGVLEERRPGEESDYSSSSSSSSASSTGEEVGEGEHRRAAKDKEKDVMGRLMGREKRQKRPAIQVVGDGS